MSLSRRRFPTTITRRRAGPGARDRHGEFQPGATVETPLRASIQPIRMEDFDEQSGARLEDMKRVYVPSPGALLAARETAEADDVVIGGVVYRVSQTEAWRGFTRALVVRSG